jgi:hypothetical protein
MSPCTHFLAPAFSGKRARGFLQPPYASTHVRTVSVLPHAERTRIFLAEMAVAVKTTTEPTVCTRLTRPPRSLALPLLCSFVLPLSLSAGLVGHAIRTQGMRGSLGQRWSGRGCLWSHVLGSRFSAISLYIHIYIYIYIYIYESCPRESVLSDVMRELMCSPFRRERDQLWVLDTARPCVGARHRSSLCGCSTLLVPVWVLDTARPCVGARHRSPL